MSCKQFWRGFITEFNEPKRNKLGFIVFTVHWPNVGREYTKKFRIAKPSWNVAFFKNYPALYKLCNCLVWNKIDHIIRKSSMQSYEPV